MSARAGGGRGRGELPKAVDEEGRGMPSMCPPRVLGEASSLERTSWTAVVCDPLHFPLQPSIFSFTIGQFDVLNGSPYTA